MEEKQKKMIMGPVVIALVIGLVGGWTIASNQYNAKLAQANSMLMKKSDEVKMMKDKEEKDMMMKSTGYVMKDGKMMIEEGGKMSAMTEDATLSNGDKVMTDGTIVKKDGTKTQLKEGQSVWMDGTMMEGGKVMK